MDDKALNSASLHNKVVQTASSVDESIDYATHRQNATIISSLALLYHRHGDASRALALGLAAMQMATPTPTLTLLVGSCFIQVGEPDQAVKTLENLDNPRAQFSTPPTSYEIAASHALLAKSFFRLEKRDQAKSALAKALSHTQGLSHLSNTLGDEPY